MVDGGGVKGHVACKVKVILGYACNIVLAILRDRRLIVIAGLCDGRSVRMPWRRCPLSDGCLVVPCEVLRHRGGAVGVILADGHRAIGPILRDGCIVQV